MKRCLSLTLAILAGTLGASRGQTVVDSTTHTGLFSPSANVTVDPIPDPEPLIGIILDPPPASGPLGNYWNATASGGAAIFALGIDAASTGAQVALSNNSLQFNVSNNPQSVLGLLGTGVSLGLQWSATATFDGSPGPVVNLQPNQVYRISFDVIDDSGLLDSTLNLAPTFGVELLNGAGTPVGYVGGGTVASILGLQLAPVLGGPNGAATATAQFRTGATVPAGAAAIRFTASAALPVTAVGLGTNFASVSNLKLVAVDPYTLWIEDSDVEDESDWDRDADPDHDGRPNIEEFALATDPARGDHGETFVRVGDADGAGPETAVCVMTMAVLDDAVFASGTGENSGDLIAPTTSVSYRVEGSFELMNWNLAISEVTPNDSFRAGLPTLPEGWSYRSFRVPGETSDTRRAFLRAVFE
ncbi:hypothetical protein [Luteolibacter luteus]|uniref:Uncharacterized protein n=1 Tax=Luteolibacter luteus TaxID=2728835 RepID=A0A858RJ92_9BACT|nr:hypothetical protein [Luteolibacter luteus]QJE96651.1 hypothetical protein HHL09_12940 [Luteolibacter luteus]